MRNYDLRITYLPWMKGLKDGIKTSEGFIRVILDKRIVGYINPPQDKKYIIGLGDSKSLNLITIQEHGSSRLSILNHLFRFDMWPVIWGSEGYFYSDPLSKSLRTQLLEKIPKSFADKRDTLKRLEDITIDEIMSLMSKNPSEIKKLGTYCKLWFTERE